MARPADDEVRPTGSASFFGAGSPRRAGRIISVGGGKGGIGKSLVSANLGVELARRGYKVVAIDADLGGANLHTCLGVDMPRATLSDYINRKINRIEDVVVATGQPNLSLISGALDSLDAANPKYAQKLKLLRNIHALDAQYVILDLGAGTGFNVLDFFLVADHGMLILVPEPTSIENGYRFLKAAFFRRLQNVEAVHGLERVVESAMKSKSGGAIRTPFDVVAAVKAADPDAGAILETQMQLFRPRLIVNQCRTPADREVGEAVVAAWRKYFGLRMDYLAAISYDDEVWRAVRKRRPVLVECPRSDAARCFATLADSLLSLDDGQVNALAG
jgi:flagellar biosynthesis protein FlhG